MGQQEKLYPPTDASVSQQRRPQLLSAKFENLVHSIFRNETSTLEINVSHFGVLHWQQWQPLMFINDLLLPGKSKSSIFNFCRCFLTCQASWQTFSQESLTITASLFFDAMAGFNMIRGNTATDFIKNIQYLLLQYSPTNFTRNAYNVRKFSS